MTMEHRSSALADFRLVFLGNLAGQGHGTATEQVIRKPLLYPLSYEGAPA
jgi:hypothetical protein